jgi:type I restriction enzyme S subunit
METVESKTGQFFDGELSKTPEVPQANTFRFGPEHVLYGKLRPYLNKVALPDFNGKCSTELIPLLPNPELDRRYLAYFLRSGMTVARISAKTAGARMPRADMDFVLSLEIPLPPLDEQRRVVDLLSRAEGIVRLRREAQKKAAKIIPALFVDVFGDPATNPWGWEVVDLGKLISGIDFGVSAALSKNAEYQPGRTGVIRIANITSAGRLDLTDVRYLEISEKKKAQLLLKQGDLLFNWRNSPNWIGKTAIVDRDLECIFASFLYRFRTLPDRADTVFIWFYLNLLRERGVFEAICRQAVSQANLGRDELAAVRVIAPPLEKQRVFSERCRQLFALRAQQEAAAEKAEAAFQSLLGRVFLEGAPEMQKPEAKTSRQRTAVA